MKNVFFLTICLCTLFMVSCDKPGTTTANESNTGLKIAYVNGDSILMNYGEFRTASEGLDLKQRDAEELLQTKGAALEQEIMAYQRKAQSGSMSPKEMETQERRLSAKQDELLRERNDITDSLMKETNEINERLQKIIKGKLNEIKDKEGYDFIFSYIQGGPILVASEKHDITKQVLDALNSSDSGMPEKNDSVQ